MVLHGFLWPQWRIGAHSHVVRSCMMEAREVRHLSILACFFFQTGRRLSPSRATLRHSATFRSILGKYGRRVKMAQEGYAFRPLRHPGGLPCTGSTSVLSTALIQGKRE